MRSCDFISGSNGTWLKYCSFSGRSFIPRASKGEGSTPRPPLSCNQTELKPPQREPEFSWLTSSSTSLPPSLKKHLSYTSHLLAVWLTKGCWDYDCIARAMLKPMMLFTSVHSSQQAGAWNLALPPANTTTTNNQCQPKQVLLLLPLHMSSRTTNGALNSWCCWGLDKQFRGQ